MTTSIGIACFPPNPPIWFSAWAAGTPADRRDRYQSARNLGLVTDREPDFNSTVAPTMFWPPGHPCVGMNGESAANMNLGAYPDEGARRTGALNPSILPAIGLNSTDLLSRALEALKSLWERLKGVLGQAKDAIVAAAEAVAAAIQRVMGPVKWAFAAAILLFLGIAYLVFDRLFPKGGDGLASITAARRIRR